ncbi:membrane anchor subunit of succinate dehydrogenase, Sdh4 [Chytridiales sp. JEL 0842]|nr:membrane anchor subunit of succinate dehydrogenase, Sdh4 [Chytridiales sp. JEL 0842]
MSSLRCLSMASRFQSVAPRRVLGTAFFHSIGVQQKSKAEGSYHWDAERALSLATIPLIGAAFAVGPAPLIDLGLGVVIPLHIHMGFDTIIQDYVPKRKYGILHTICVWLLRAGTALTFYGCYEFNTNDVGITAFFKRLWTGKL